MKPIASPPRLALWLLRLSVPRLWDLSVLGDLEEEWRLRQSGALSRSPLSLRWWFAKQALSVCSGFLRHRSREGLGRLWGRFGGRSPDPGQSANSKERLSESLRQDLSLALRLMVRNPGFTLVTVLTLGLGIGANTAIFSVVNGVLLRPFPYPAPHKIVHISALLMEGKMSFGGSLAESHFKALRQRSRSLEALSFYTSRTLQLSGIEEPRVVAGARVSSGFFEVMGIAPIRGRGFRAREEQPGGPAAAVISYGLWQSLLGGRQDVLEHRLTLDEEEYAIVGVASPQLRFPSDTQVWLPHTLNPQGGSQNPVIARISEGTDMEQARAEIEGIVLTAWEEEGAITDQARITLTSFYERAVGAIRPALMAFFAAVMLVLLIACANVAHLMLARSAEREREFAVRAALGAGRMRLVRQLLVESSLLSGTGAVLGLLGAYWAVRAYVAFSPANVPRLEEVRIDVGVLAFTLVLAVLTGIAFGLLPALRAARPRLGDALQEGHHSSGGPRRAWMRGILVVGEVSSALVLLVAAGLLIHSFALLMAVDPGYDPRQVLTAKFQPSQARYPGGSEKLRLYRNLAGLARSHHRVEAAAFGSHAPMANRWFLTEIRLQGGHDPSSSGQVFWQVVSPDYFRTLRIPLLEGRRLNGNDDRDSVDVVILNRRLARGFFGERSPLGQTIYMGREQQRPLLVVGVVGDAQPNQLSNPLPPLLYLPALQIGEQNVAWNMGMFVILRVAPGENPADFAPLLAGQARSLDPNLLPTETASLESRLSRSAAQPRFYASLAGLFGVAALLLVSVGIYGVVSYFVSRRTHEIAVRMALGARPGHVLRIVLGRGMSLVGAGTALGLAGALATARLLSSQLFGITSSDAATYAAVALFLMGVALLACYLPARRATRADPLEALRSE